MSATERRKGARGELQVVELCHAHGWPRARRNFMSGGRGGGDVIEGPPGVHIEVKWRERLNVPATMDVARVAARPTDQVCLAHRRNHGGWLGTTDLDDLFALYELLGAS